MSNLFTVHKSESSKLRKLPFLPRLGVTVDVAGRQFTFRHVPTLETFLNWRERGFSLRNLANLSREELSEVRLPALKPLLTAIKDLTAKRRAVAETPNQSGQKQRKGPARAAAARRKGAEAGQST